MHHTAIVILAAGKASRMGSPKQLLSYKGRTFLQHAIAAAQEVAGEQVIVVLGAYSDQIAPTISGVQSVQNDAWETGMASSIRTGLTAAQDAYPHIEKSIFIVADQPFISARLLTQMMACKQGIVACNYSGITGTPVLFSKQYFPLLMTLAGDEGAKKLLKQYIEDVGTVAFEAGAIDIDTPEDYEKLK